jgi:uncharacterized protein
MQKRLLYYELSRYIPHKNALVITGMRQVGKTTLLRQIYDSLNEAKLWFDLDNPLDMLHFEDIDYHKIYHDLKKLAGNGSDKLFVFIDEIQNFPEITKIIKFHIDHYNVKYIITGSSNFYLRNLFPESLSGRMFLFILHPLDFREIIYFKNNLEPEEIEKIPRYNSELKIKLTDYKQHAAYYEEYLEFGGFPEVVTTEDVTEKRLILRNIFASFFEKDLTLLSDIRDVRELRNLILLMVPRTGNLLDITKIASELGTNRMKVYDYLEFLQGVFFLKLIPKFSKSIDRSVAGGKKIYFSDTGILNTIGKVNEGQLFENAVANQLSVYGDLSFYNQRNTAEIDFIVEKHTCFEAKLTATSQAIQRLNIQSGKIGIGKSYVVSKNYVGLEGVIYPMFL